MTKATKTPKKVSNTTKRRAFPYDRVAKLWAQGKKIAQIATAIDRVGKSDDPYRGLRIALTRMHKGYKNAEGNIVKLGYNAVRCRMSASRSMVWYRAGKRAAARVQNIAEHRPGCWRASETAVF
jgi:hypothetical protein